MKNFETGSTTRRPNRVKATRRPEVGKPRQARLGRSNDLDRPDQPDGPYRSVMPVKFIFPAQPDLTRLGRWLGLAPLGHRARPTNLGCRARLCHRAQLASLCR